MPDGMSDVSPSRLPAGTKSQQKDGDGGISTLHKVKGLEGVSR